LVKEREFIRNRRESACFGDHHFRISSVRGYSRCHWVLAVHSVSTPARFAHTVFSRNEADANPLTDFPSGYSAAQAFDAAHYFMPGNARQLQPRVNASDGGCVGVTDSACFHPNPNLSRSRLGDFPFHNSKRARGGDFHCSVCACHLNLLFFSNILYFCDKDLFSFRLPPSIAVKLTDLRSYK
jgi:hypothetical protein